MDVYFRICDLTEKDLANFEFDKRQCHIMWLLKKKF